MKQDIEYWAILARCSEEEQAEDGYSIEVQINDSMKILKDLSNAILYKVYADEGYPGSDPYIKRPNLLQMLADAKSKKFKGLIIWKADRLGRLANEREELVLMLHKYRINIICCSGENLMDNSPQGKFIRKTFANVDELEVEILAMRVKGAINNIIENGEWKGGNIPYGYKWIREDKSKKTPGKMIPISEEHIEQIELIFKLYVNNLMGFNSIRDYLNGNNINKTIYPYYKNGEKHKWNKDHVKTALKCPLYCGYQYNNNVYTKFEPREDGLKHKPKNQWEMHPVNFIKAFISKDMFSMAQNIMQKKANKTMTITKTTWLLTGILKCANCESPFTGHPMRTKYTRKKDGNTVIYDSSFYRCTGIAQYGREYCNVKQIAKKLIEETVIEKTINYILILKQLISENFITDSIKIAKKSKDSNHNRLSIINKELDKIEKGLKRAIKDYQNGELKTQAYNLVSEDFLKRREALEFEKIEIQAVIENQIDIKEELKQLKNYIEQWEQSLLKINYSNPESIMIAKSTLIHLVDYIKWNGKDLDIQFIKPKQLVNFLYNNGGQPTGQPTQLHKKRITIENILKDEVPNNFNFTFKNVVNANARKDFITKLKMDKLK